MIAPTFAPVIISAAMTSVYAVIAPWIPVTVVPTSSATVGIGSFITVLSRGIRTCPAASVIRTFDPPAAPFAGSVFPVTRREYRGLDGVPQGVLRRRGTP